METIFKVGDRVFEINMGWGTVQSIRAMGSVPIEVHFDRKATDTNGPEVPSAPMTCYYSSEGRVFEGGEKMLSFTEYNLKDGGFSQARQPKYGQLIYVRTCDNGVKTDWELRYFSHMNREGDGVYCFVHRYAPETIFFIDWSETCPLPDRIDPDKNLLKSIN